MTDNEIIKALECCGGDNYEEDCPKCPMHNDGDCNCHLAKLSLDLINRQKAEIERLERSAKQWEDTAKDLYISTENIKAKATKEFIKRFEMEIKDVKFTIGQTWEIQSALKEVKKEMVGEG